MDERTKARYIRNRKRKRKRTKKRRDFINNYKIEKGCRICGYNKDPVNLIFLEWPGPLRLKISYLIKKGVRWDEVLEHVEHSEIFCKKHAYRHRRSYLIIDKNDVELTRDEVKTYQGYLARIKETEV